MIFLVLRVFGRKQHLHHLNEILYESTNMKGNAKNMRCFMPTPTEGFFVWNTFLEFHPNTHIQGQTSVVVVVVVVVVVAFLFSDAPNLNKSRSFCRGRRRRRILWLALLVRQGFFAARLGQQSFQSTSMPEIPHQKKSCSKVPGTPKMAVLHLVRQFWVSRFRYSPT